MGTIQAAADLSRDEQSRTESHKLQQELHGRTCQNQKQCRALILNKSSKAIYHSLKHAPRDDRAKNSQHVMSPVLIDFGAEGGDVIILSEITHSQLVSTSSTQ